MTKSSKWNEKKRNDKESNLKKIRNIPFQFRQRGSLWLAIHTHIKCIQKRTSSRESCKIHRAAACWNRAKWIKATTKKHTHTEEERNNKLNVKYTCETKHGWENRVASENPCFLYTKYGLLCIWVFYPTDDGTHAPAIQPANNIHMPKKQPRDFGIFLLWILKWNFLQTHERLKRARRTPHYSTSAHSSSQIHPNKIWITVFGWHAALAIVINVPSVEAESRLMNDLLASVRSNQIQLNVILQSD